MTTDVDGSAEVQPDVVKLGDELVSLVCLLGERLTADHRLGPDPAVKLRLSSPANISQVNAFKESRNFCLTLDSPSCPRLASWTLISRLFSDEGDAGGVC